jgi:hypothetical protein
MIALRHFTEKGVEEFKNYIQQVRQNPNAQRPDLNNPPYSEEFIPRVEVDELPGFRTRLEIAEYLDSRFRNVRVSSEQIIGEHGIWTWLAYLWFDLLCSLSPNGTRSVREDARYICSRDYTDYYRHYIAAAYDIYTIHGSENSRLFLCCPVNVHNDFVEQLSARQFIISHRNIIKVAHDLYWDRNNNLPRRGAQSRNRPGNLRRFIKFIQQIELTYNVFYMDAAEILQLLPSEFNRWRNNEEG